MMRTKKLWFIIVAVALVVIGCTTNDDDSPKENAEAEHTPT